MLEPLNIPSDPNLVHPWIASLLNKDTDFVTEAIKKRLRRDTIPDNASLVRILDDFIPRRVEWKNGIGYVLCIKRKSLESPTLRSTDMFYLAEPLELEALKKEIAYFDESLREPMIDFMWQFAGGGESNAGGSGQFARSFQTTAEEIACNGIERLGDWKESRVLYHAQNGDSLLINPNGSTAWHIFEMDEVFALFETISGFGKHYLQFRTTDKIFDSYNSFELIGRTPWN